MPCEIIWHPEAVRDQFRLFTHLKSVNPAAATKAAELIRQGAEKPLEMAEPLQAHG